MVNGFVKIWAFLTNNPRESRLAILGLFGDYMAGDPMRSIYPCRASNSSEVSIREQLFVH